MPISTGKSFRGYTVDSLEMSNHDKGLFPKDIVIGEFVPKKDYKRLDNGQVLLVLVEKQLLLRRVFITNNTLVLRADHKVIEDITVELEHVKEIWRVCYVFYHRIPETGDGLEEKLMYLEKEFRKLKAKI